MPCSRATRWWFGMAVVVLAACDPQTGLVDVPPSIALSNTALQPTAIVAGAAVSQSVTIVNGTDGVLQNITVEVRYTNGTGWLTATLDRTTATRTEPATLTVSTAPGALAVGNYDASIRVSAAGAGNGPLLIAVRFGVQPRPAAKLAVVTQPSGTLANGLTFAQQPVIQLLNTQDQPVARAGVAVTASIGTGGGQLTGGATILTDAAGRAAFVDLGVTGLAGPRTLSFSAPNLTGVTSTAVTLTAGAPRRLEAIGAATQLVDAGTVAPDVPRVRVVDESGNGVAGVPVTFVASAGSTIGVNAPVSSGADGSAGVGTWTLRPQVGTNTVTATSTGLAGSPLIFTATGRAGSISQLVKESGDNLVALVGTVAATPHVVRAADRFGNGVAGIAITWSVTGGGSVAPTTGTTDANGRTQATRTMAATAAAGTTEARATVGGATLLASFVVSAVNAGPAQIIKVSGDAQSAGAGTTLPQPLRVQVLDALGAPQAGVTVTFTTPQAGGSFPGGATPQTDANGFAQTTWRLAPVSGPQTAQGAIGGPAPAVFTATALAGAVSATQSSIAVSPASIRAGGPGSTITVTARDASGNPIVGVTVVVANTGGGTLTQPAAPTNAQGEATATYTSTVTGSRTVSATIAGTAISATATITVSAGNPVAFNPISSTVFSVRFGQAVAPLPSVQALDAFGNGVSGIVVSFGITAGQSAISPATVTTNAAGIATLGSWLIASFNGLGTPQSVYNSVVASAPVPGSVPITYTGIVAVSFNSDIYPYLQGGCATAGCHNAQVPVMNQAAGTVYTTLLNPNQRYVVPGDSINSSTTANLMWRKNSGLQAHTGGTKAASVLTVIKAWIRQGALNN